MKTKCQDTYENKKVSKTFVNGRESNLKFVKMQQSNSDRQMQEHIFGTNKYLEAKMLRTWIVSWAILTVK